MVKAIMRHGLLPLRQTLKGWDGSQSQVDLNVTLFYEVAMLEGTPHIDLDYS
jgi:hypothetical protein